MSSNGSNSNSADDTRSSSSNMQAWLQTHLENYVKLGFLDKVPGPSSSWQDGRALACLAHRFCPSAVPDLVGILDDENDPSVLRAMQILHSELGVPHGCLTDEASLTAYLEDIRRAVEDQQAPTKQAMRFTEATLVAETQTIQVTRRTREPSACDDDEFERLASNVLNRSHQLRTQLNDMTLMTTTTSTRQQPPPPPQHPDAATQQEGEDKSGDEDGDGDLAARVEQFEADLARFEAEEMGAYRAYVQTLNDTTALASRMQAVEAAYAALNAQLGDDFKAIQTGVLFSQLTNPIRHELESVQAKMLKTTTTEQGIRELEERTQHAGALLDAMENEHGDTMLSKSLAVSYRAHFDALRQKHRVVCSWVDEVRVWFVEAERIRRWIEERIALLESRALEHDPVQALSVQPDSVEAADSMTTAHEALEKEVETFDREDMTRLRAHVKALMDKQQHDSKDLSPADTTTIEITFTTLTTLDRLMHMLRRRSHELQMLTLRLFWEQEHATAEAWVAETDAQVDMLVARARWQQDEDRSSNGGSTTDTVVRELLDLEQRVADFDQGQFTVAVNMYQDMDNHSKVELPAHLEARQVAIEEAFEALTKRIAYVRQVVEQRITIVDFVYRADELVEEGGRIKEEMAIAEQQATVGDSDREFMDRIRQFQERAVELVTTVAVRIRYPQDAFLASDAQTNDNANATIRTLIGDRKSTVILFGDMLDQKLSAYQYLLEMLTTADQLLRELRALHDKAEHQIKSIAHVKDDVLGARCPLSHDDAERLQRECDGQQTKLEALRDGDAVIMREATEALRKDVVALNASAVPIGRLDAAMERLEQLLRDLGSALTVHAQELLGLQARLHWKDAWTETMQQINAMTQDVWDLTDRMQWRVDTVEPGVEVEQMDTAYEDMDRQIDTFKQTGHLDTVASSFSSMTDVLSNIDKTVPEHFQRRQDTLDRAFDELLGFLAFSHGVIDQHKALAEFSSKASSMLHSGTKLVEEIETALRRVMDEEEKEKEEGTSAFTEAIQRYDDQVQHLLSTTGEAIPYPARPGAGSADAYRTAADHDYIHAEIQAFVQEQGDKLKQVHDRMMHLASLHETALQFKASIVAHAAEARALERQAAELSKSILPDRQNLGIDKISLDSAADPAALTARHTERAANAESTRRAFLDLKERVAALSASIEQSNCRAHVQDTMASTALATLEGTCQELVQLSERHSNELNVYSDRIRWETSADALLSDAHRLQDQLRDLDEDNKKRHLSARIDEQALQEAQARLDALQQPLTDLACRADETDKAYTVMKTSYDVLLDVHLPQAVMDRHNDANGTVRRVRDLAEQLGRDHSLIERRRHWETTADTTSAAGLDLEQRLEEFLRSDARWSADAPAETSSSSNSALADWMSKVDAQGEQVTRMAAGLDDLFEQQHLYRCEALSRRRHELQTAHDRLACLMAFVAEVDSQRQQFSACVQQAEQLETRAEALRKQIEADDEEGASAALEQLVEQVHAFSHAACNIPYPVRSFRGHDARARNQDSTANTVMQETLHVRQSRVEQLPGMLKAAVEARTMQNEKHAAAEAYMAESRTLQGWITTKLDALDDVFSLPAESAVQDLRNAATTVDAIHSAVQANEGAFRSLGVQALKLEDDDDVQKQHAELTRLWSTLADRLGAEAKDTLVARLHAAEYNEATQQLSRECQAIQAAMDATTVPELSKDKLRAWGDQIDTLKSQLYETAGVQAANESERNTYKQLTSEHAKLVAGLDGLNKKLREREMLEDYRTRTATLTAFFTDSAAHLDRLQQEFGTIAGAAEDENQCRLFNDAYSAMQRTVQDKMGDYREQQSFYRALQLQAIDTGDVCADHDALEAAQRTLADSLDAARLAASLATQWKDLHATLRAVESELAKSHGNDNDDGDDDSDSSRTKDAESQMAALDARLATASAMSDKLVAAATTTATATTTTHTHADDNKRCFEQRYTLVREAVAQAKRQLEAKKAAAKERADQAAFVEAAHRVVQAADQEQRHVQERAAAAADVCREIGQQQQQQQQQQSESTAALEQHYRARVASTAATEADMLDTLVEQCDTLAAKPAAAATDTTSAALAAARDAVDALKQAVDGEKKANDLIRRALGHAKTADNIAAWIGNCRQAIDTAAEEMALADDKDIDEDVQDIQTKMTNFGGVVGSFTDMTAKIVEDAHGDDGVAAAAAISEVVQVRAQRIDTEWHGLEREFADLQAAMTRTAKSIAIVRQMRRILQLCGDARERVGRLESSSARLMTTAAAAAGSDGSSSGSGSSNNGSVGQHALAGMLREQDVLTAQQELDAVESKVNSQVAEEIGTLDGMLGDLEGASDTFAQQRTEMGAAVANLTTAVADKKQQLGRALDVGRCLVITDDIEVLVSALEDAAAKATDGSHPAASRTDLQARAIELDARYKYYERKIVQSLDAAQLAAGDITNEDDRELVLRHVRELRERWEVVDRQVQAQKAELSKSLAAARPAGRTRKSSLPTRKAAHTLRDRSPSRLPTSRSSSLHPGNSTSPLLLAASSRLAKSTSSSHVAAVRPGGPSRSKLAPPPPLSSSSMRRRPSRSATSAHAKPPPPPAIQVTRANKYVADPHNDLDMEIGRIVNETPYKVKVKMVPGEVGRYWFGDANPKLAYCRVLKSKMVMVRVGGGWMELTEFLRQHALLEGDFIPRGSSSASDEPADEPRIREGFIETRKQRQRIRDRSPASSASTAPAPSSSSGSHSTPQGYIDGDRYIAVDRYGNQLEVKMTKASMNQSTSSSTTASSRRKLPARHKQQQ